MAEGRLAGGRGAGRLDQPREPRRLAVPRYDAEAFGRWAEAIARFMGTARFLVYMTVVIAAWVVWNTMAPRSWQFDPYTFTFLTLVLSLQASYAAPLILLAQNRQADRDRLAMDEDRRRAAMQKADTEYLARELASLRIAIGEVATRDFVRSELVRLVEELDEAERRRRRLERKEQRREAHRTAENAATAADRGVTDGAVADRGAADRTAADEVVADPSVAERGGAGRAVTESDVRAGDGADHEEPADDDRDGDGSAGRGEGRGRGGRGAAGAGRPKKAPRASRG